MLEDIRRVLGIRPNTDAAEYLDSILEAYRLEQEEAATWATSSEGSGAFEKFGQQLIVMARPRFMEVVAIRDIDRRSRPAGGRHHQVPILIRDCQIEGMGKAVTMFGQ